MKKCMEAAYDAGFRSFSLMSTLPGVPRRVFGLRPSRIADNPVAPSDGVLLDGSDASTVALALVLRRVLIVVTNKQRIASVLSRQMKIELAMLTVWGRPMRSVSLLSQPRRRTTAVKWTCGCQRAATQLRC